MFWITHYCFVMVRAQRHPNPALPPRYRTRGCWETALRASVCWSCINYRLWAISKVKSTSGDLIMTKWPGALMTYSVCRSCNTEEMPMHVSSSLFIAKAVWLPRLWLTAFCFPSCSITSLTPTCGSSALWQAGRLTLWRRRAEAQMTGVG